MTDFLGSFQAQTTVTAGTAGTRSTTSSFGLTVNITAATFAVTNRLVLTVDTPTGLTVTPDTPGTLSL